MTHDDRPAETFEEFRTSFSYGSRTDLNFKFLKSASDDEAAAMFQQLLGDIGDAFDTGDLDRIIATAIAAQAAGYRPAPDAPPAANSYDTGPFAPTSMPMSGSTVGLISSTGHFVAGDDPEPFGITDMTQDEAVDRISDFLKDTPILSAVPTDTPDEDIRIRHGGFDITSAARDRNVAFPVDRLRELADAGLIGGVTSTAFSFPGATAQGRLKKVLPEWIDRVTEDEPDVMLLVPV